MTGDKSFNPTLTSMNSNIGPFISEVYLLKVCGFMGPQK